MLTVTVLALLAFSLTKRMVTIAFHMMVFTPVSHHKAVNSSTVQLFASLILNTALLFIIVYCIYQYTIKV